MGCVNLNLDRCPSMAVDALKHKVICEFLDLLHALEKGHKKDYEFILEEISLIELLENSEINRSEFLEQFYLNNKWETF